MEHAKGRLTSLVKTRELADEALRSQTKAYEAGLATGLDVVDAELALSRLQVADLKAHFDAVVAWLGLLEACGEVANAGQMLQDLRPVEKAAPAETPAAPAATLPLPMTQPAANAENAAPAEQAPQAAPATESKDMPATPAATEAVEQAPAAAPETNVNTEKAQ